MYVYTGAFNEDNFQGYLGGLRRFAAVSEKYSVDDNRAFFKSLLKDPKARRPRPTGEKKKVASDKVVQVNKKNSQQLVARQNARKNADAADPTPQCSSTTYTFGINGNPKLWEKGVSNFTSGDPDEWLGFQQEILFCHKSCRNNQKQREVKEQKKLIGC